MLNKEGEELEDTLGATELSRVHGDHVTNMASYSEQWRSKAVRRGRSPLSPGATRFSFPFWGWSTFLCFLLLWGWATFFMLGRRGAIHLPVTSSKFQTCRFDY